MVLVVQAFANDPLNYPHNFSSPLSNADDDNFNTGTTADSGAVWGGPDIHRGIIFDFGSLATVSTIKIYGNYIEQLTPSAGGSTSGPWSNIPGTWEQVGYSQRNFTVTQNTSGRYLRLSHHISNPGLIYFTWITISEVEIDGVLGTGDPPEEPPPVLEPPEDPVILFPVVRGTAWVEPS